MHHAGPRWFSDKATPFYIGESGNLRARLKSHLASKNIADILRGIPVPGAPVISQGAKTFHFAYFIGKRKQEPKKCITLAQKFMIRDAIANGIPLLNSHLLTIKAHEIEFQGTAELGSIFSGIKFLQE